MILWRNLAGGERIFIRGVVGQHGPHERLTWSSRKFRESFFFIREEWPFRDKGIFWSTTIYSHDFQDGVYFIPSRCHCFKTRNYCDNWIWQHCDEIHHGCNVKLAKPRPTMANIFILSGKTRKIVLWFRLWIFGVSFFGVFFGVCNVYLKVAYMWCHG